MNFNFGWIPLIQQELRRFFASKAQGALADSALQPATIGSSVQAYDADLAAIAALVSTGALERTGAGAFETFAATAFGKSIIAAANATAARTTLSLTIGSNVQAWDTDLDALAAISTTGPIERTGAGTWAVSDRIRLFGGNGGLSGTSDYTSTNGDTLADGIYYFRNFTVTTGHTITIGRLARIYCSGTFTVQSGATITVTQAIRQATSRPGLTSNRTYQQEGGTFGPSFNYNPYQFPVGAAGSSGGAQAGTGGMTNVSVGGEGGGAIWVEANGAISVSGTITATGGNGSGPISPTGEHSSGGGGGGSGGAIKLTSLASITIASTATLSVAGGNGGNGSVGGYTNARGYGGNGGGGGWVWLTAPTITTAGSTITLSGGTAGTTGSSGTVANTQGGGYGGSFAGNGGYTSGDGGSGSVGQLITRTYKAVA